MCSYLPHLPQIIGERNCGIYNHCTTSTRFLQLTMTMMMISVRANCQVSIQPELLTSSTATSQTQTNRVTSERCDRGTKRSELEDEVRAVVPTAAALTGSKGFALSISVLECDEVDFACFEVDEDSLSTHLACLILRIINVEKKHEGTANEYEIRTQEPNKSNRSCAMFSHVTTQIPDRLASDKLSDLPKLKGLKNMQELTRKTASQTTEKKRVKMALKFQNRLDHIETVFLSFRNTNRFVVDHSGQGANVKAGRIKQNKKTLATRHPRTSPLLEQPARGFSQWNYEPYELIRYRSLLIRLNIRTTVKAKLRSKQNTKPEKRFVAWIVLKSVRRVARYRVQPGMKDIRLQIKFIKCDKDIREKRDIPLAPVLKVHIKLPAEGATNVKLKILVDKSTPLINAYARPLIKNLQKTQDNDTDEANSQANDLDLLTLQGGGQTVADASENVSRANVFTLERCDWLARLIERRPSNCPGCDDRLTRQSGPRKVQTNRLATERLADLDVRRTYQNRLLGSLPNAPPSDVNAYWDEIATSLHSAGNLACGTAPPGVLKHWISNRTVALFKSRRKIPAGPEHNLVRRIIRHQVKASVKADREVWWTQKAKEMEEDQKSGNARRLFQLIRATGPRKPPVSETIKDRNGVTISNKEERVTCDACQQKEFRLRRYKCLVCRNYDLCGECFDNRQATEKHSSSHPMQCLIPRADHDLFFHGEPSSEYMTYSFTCPLCGQLGFTETSFSRHVFQKHPGEEAGDPEVICPLCATHSEGGDHNRQTRHMARHLIATHHLTAPKEDENGILLVPYLQSYRNVRTTDPPSSHNSVAPQPSRSVYSIHPRYSTHRRLLPFVISRPPRSQESARNVCCLGTNRSRLTGTPLSHNLSPCETMCDILSTTGRPNRSIQNSFSSSLVCGAMATQQSSAVAIFSGRNSRNQDNEGKTVSLSTTSPHAACTVHTRINAAHTDALVDLSSLGWGAVVQ
ncbi:E3 ubiquitin-protein ligase KCMF1, partial [Clonorchis sinensis]